MPNKEQGMGYDAWTPLDQKLLFFRIFIILKKTFIRLNRNRQDGCQHVHVIVHVKKTPLHK